MDKTELTQKIVEVFQTTPKREGERVGGMVILPSNQQQENVRKLLTQVLDYVTADPSQIETKRQELGI